MIHIVSETEWGKNCTHGNEHRMLECKWKEKAILWGRQ